MAHKKRGSALIAQQRRLLGQLESLSRTVAEMESDLEAEYTKTSGSARAASTGGRFAALKDRFRLRINRKRPRMALPGGRRWSRGNPAEAEQH